MHKEKKINYELELNENKDNTPDSKQKDLINPIQRYEEMLFHIIDRSQKGDKDKDDSEQ
ncbi:MAG: hypothetical protein ACQESZ_08040 [Bacteroidota bacterium]